MSREDVEVVGRFYTRYRGDYDAFRRDPDGLFSMLHPDIEWHPLTGALVEGVPYRGHEGIRQYFDDLAESWEASWVAADRLLDAGDCVVVIGRIHSCGKGSGVEMEIPAAWVWKVREGRVTYMRVYLDRSEAFEAAGLRESSPGR
jgi:ketosteroid isomerase-like protein